MSCLSMGGVCCLRRTVLAIRPLDLMSVSGTDVYLRLPKLVRPARAKRRNYNISNFFYYRELIWKGSSFDFGIE